MRNLLLLLTAALLLTLAATAQSGATSEFNVDGMEVIFKPTTKQIVNVSVYFRGGVANYPAQKAGIENLALNGALDCGTAGYPTAGFKDKADGIGARLTAVAGLDNGRISLNCIARYFNEGWDLLASAVTTPAFAENDFGRLKEKLTGEVDLADGNPDHRLESLAMEAAFGGTPYAVEPDGTKATLSGLTMPEVKDYYYRTLLNKARMFIVVVGPLNKEDIAARIKAAFGQVPLGTYTARVATVPAFGVTPYKTLPRTLATNYIMGIVNAPAYSSEDYVPYLLAFSELYAVLFTEIRMKRNLSYEPDASVHAGLMPFADVYVSTTEPQQTVDLMVKILRNMRDASFANRSLEQIKAGYIVGSYRRQESTDALAEMLGKAETLGGWAMAEQLPAVIQQTTRKQIMDAFNKYVNGITWAYLGDIEKAKETLDAFNKTIL